MSALKFGWNACFGGSNGHGDAVTISDAALDAIIDRTRTCDSKVTELLNSSNDGNKNKGSLSVKTEGIALGLELQEGQQSSVMAFEEAAPLVDLRQFEGQTVHKKTTGTYLIFAYYILSMRLFLVHIVYALLQLLC